MSPPPPLGPAKRGVIARGGIPNRILDGFPILGYAPWAQAIPPPPASPPKMQFCGVNGVLGQGMVTNKAKCGLDLRAHLGCILGEELF